MGQQFGQSTGLGRVFLGLGALIGFHLLGGMAGRANSEVLAWLATISVVPTVAIVVGYGLTAWRRRRDLVGIAAAALAMIYGLYHSYKFIVFLWGDFPD